MNNLSCKCRGIDGRAPCEGSASEEDGFCDWCRETDCMGETRRKTGFDYRAIDPEFAQQLLDNVGDENFFAKIKMDAR